MTKKLLLTLSLLVSMSSFGQGRSYEKTDDSNKVSVGDLEIFKTVLDPFQMIYLDDRVDYLDHILKHLNRFDVKGRILAKDIRSIKLGNYTPYTTSISHFDHNLKDVNARTAEMINFENDVLNTLFDQNLVDELEKMTVEVDALYYKALARPIEDGVQFGQKQYKTLVSVVSITFNVTYRKANIGNRTIIDVNNIRYNRQVEFRNTNKDGKLPPLMRQMGSRSSAGG